MLLADFFLAEASFVGEHTASPVISMDSSGTAQLCSGLKNQTITRSPTPRPWQGEAAGTLHPGSGPWEELSSVEADKLASPLFPGGIPLEWNMISSSQPLPGRDTPQMRLSSLVMARSHRALDTQILSNPFFPLWYHPRFPP